MKPVICIAVSMWLQAVAWAAPPSPPPPPPADFPTEVEGYDAYLLYSVYARLTREGVRLAREDLIETLLAEVSNHVPHNTGGTLTLVMSVKMSSEFEHGNRLMEIYKMCNPGDEEPECQLKANLSGPVTSYGTELELMNNFDVYAAVEWLKDRKIAPQDVDGTSLSQLTYLGQQNPEEAYKQVLRAMTLDESQCPQMRKAFEDLKSVALFFEPTGEIPWPHGGFATVQFLEDGDEAQPVSVVGYNKQSIFLAVVEFQNIIDKCADGLVVE